MPEPTKIQSNILSAAEYHTDKYTYQCAMVASSDEDGKAWVIACSPYHVVAAVESGCEPAEPYYVDRDGRRIKDGKWPDVPGTISRSLDWGRDWVTINMDHLVRLVDAIRTKDPDAITYVHVGVDRTNGPIAVMVRGYEAFGLMMPCLPRETVPLCDLFADRVQRAALSITKNESTEDPEAQS